MAVYTRLTCFPIANVDEPNFLLTVHVGHCVCS
jgi:hypothetical protein